MFAKKDPGLLPSPLKCNNKSLIYLLGGVLLTESTLLLFSVNLTSFLVDAPLLTEFDEVVSVEGFPDLHY